jgi:hypothetical protein
VSFLQESLSFDAAQIVLERDEKGDKNLFMKGLCIQGDVKNANQRIYPVNEITNAVKTLKEQIGGGYSVLGELDHPDDLKIVTVDVVAQPSAPDAYPTAIYEGLLNMDGGSKLFEMAADARESITAQRYLRSGIMQLIKDLKL